MTRVLQQKIKELLRLSKTGCLNRISKMNNYLTVQIFSRARKFSSLKNPAELLFKDEISIWNKDRKIEFYITVDRGLPEWGGNIGVITTLIPPLNLNLENTVAALVGPPVMYKFVLMALKTKRLPEANIYMSLERRMKCGVGKCGHCQINHSYVCQDGPVYHYPVIKSLEEAI